MTRLVRPLIAGALFLLALQSVHAAEGDKTSAPKFESLDKDSNGKVSLTEASEHDALFVAFKNLDKNKDGELTKDEFASYSAAR